MITESRLHQLIGSFIIKFGRSPKCIKINSSHYLILPESIKIKFSGLLEKSYFLPFNDIEVL